MSLEERQREDKEQRRRAIIEGAERVLREKTVESMTTTDVAEAARLSRGLLYVYFEDMEDIVLAVTLRGFEDLRRRFERVVAKHETGLEQIRAVGESYVRFAHEQPVYFDLVARFEARSADPDHITDRERQCLEESDRVMKAMTGAIEAGIDDGSIRPDLDPMQTAITLWGATHGLIQLVAKKGEGMEKTHGFSPETLIQESLDFIGVALTGACQHHAPNIPRSAPHHEANEG